MALRDSLTVMVVDDMSTSRGLITQALDAMGIQNVATAADGRSALAGSVVPTTVSDVAGFFAFLGLATLPLI